MFKTSLIFAALLSLSISSFAAEFKVKKVKTLGDMKHSVIFQSKDLKKVKGTNLLKGKLVAQWGLHVYEVVTGFYACSKDLSCKLTTYERIATFEKCTVVSKTKVECRKRISGDSTVITNDVVVAEDPDSVYDDVTRNLDEEGDFPVRTVDEFDGIF